MKRLSRRKKHLETYIDSHAPPKLIHIFCKDLLEKPIVTFLSLDFALTMTRHLVSKKPKQKRSHSHKRTNKRDKN